ncbi:MAG TPA: sugar porter family MFS transporter [Verrucomicrobiae bacterium]
MNHSSPPHSLADIAAGTKSGKLMAPLIGATFAAALGGLLFGFDTIVISGCQQQIKDLFHLSGFQQGFMTASALVGAVIGALLAGKPGDLFGRRDSLKVAGLCFLLCALGCMTAPNLEYFITFRFLGGLAVGATSVLCPMYIAEISPASWRGRLVAFFQFNIVLGCLVALFSNYVIGTLNLGEAEWRWKLGVQAVPSLAFLIMLFFIPRSPRWLAMKGLTDEAETVLKSVGTEDAKAQLQIIQKSLREDVVGGKAPLFVRSHLKPILLACTVAMFNQLDGINALWYYLNPIFTMAGFTKLSGDLQAVFLGIANMIATMAGIAIIDRVGRKPLLLWGAIGTGVCMGLVAWVFNGHEHHDWLVWLLVGFVICHAFGQGAVIWVYISEIFPTAVRGKGQALGSFTHWFMAMVISWTFPMVARDAGQPQAGLPFAFFAVMMVLQTLVVWKFFPETKRVALEDIQQHMGGH